MKIETIKEIHQQTLVVNNILTIELSQENDEPLKIRLIPHYEDAVHFVVRDWEGNSHTIALQMANQALVDYLLSKATSEIINDLHE